MTLFMETTEISPEVTVQQIQKVLAKYGARQVLTEYERNMDTGEMAVAAVSFQVEIEAGRMMPFRLPCRWRAIAQIFFERRSYNTDAGVRAVNQKARRVAWRQILRWVEAQFALVETSMVKVHEVFLPYLQGQSGETVFEQLERTKFQMLEQKDIKP
jgi:hypothetical protein